MAQPGIQRPGPVSGPGRHTLPQTARSPSRRSAPLGPPALVGVVALLLLVESLLRLRDARRAARAARRLAAEVAGRHAAERARRSSERRFRAIVQASPTGLLMLDASHRVALANPHAERLFGHPPGGLDGLPLATVLPDVAEGLCAAPPRDLPGRRSDGTTLPVQVSLSPIGDGADAMLLAAVVDVGARQAQQAQLRAALAEKTVLLDEVHHRVKNNLQVIISLLALQARGASPEVCAALADTRHRVHAMALTHQLLHEHGDASRLPAGEYLARLGRVLADGHRASSPGVTLVVEGTDAPVRLTLSQAIPCGLLVNELAGNAYRHAFPGGRAGTIRIALSRDGAVATIVVEDDGVGLPADLDPSATQSLGLQLVPLLVEQLDARLRRLPGPGTRFELRLPIGGERSR